MKVSVIIPTYNPQEYLWECLNSLENQTLNKDKFEILLVLNGCDEPYKTHISDYISSNRKKLNIQIIHTAVTGVSNARNIGIEAAKGEYIAFIDDDDYVSPGYLECLLKYSTPDCVALTDSIYFDEAETDMDYNNIHHKEYLKYRDCSHPSIFHARRFFNGPVMKLIHRDIIGQRRFDRRFKNGEDSLFMALISDKIKNCHFCPNDAVYYRRIRTNSATTTHRSLSMKINNSFKATIQYFIYWIKKPFSYNCLFMASRIAAQMKILLMN